MQIFFEWDTVQNLALHKLHISWETTAQLEICILNNKLPSCTLACMELSCVLKDILHFAVSFSSLLPCLFGKIYVVLGQIHLRSEFSKHFFCKELDSRYFQLCRAQSLSGNYPAQLQQSGEAKLYHFGKQPWVIFQRLAMGVFQ